MNYQKGSAPGICIIQSIQSTEKRKLLAYYVTMHELPIIEKIVEIAETKARQHSAGKILSLTLETGALSDLEPEWLNFYFKKASKGTLLAGAELKVIPEKAVLRCRNCTYKKVYTRGQPILSAAPGTCPSCGIDSLELKADSHYTLKEMEIE